MSKRGSKSKYVVDTSQLALLYEQYHRKIFNNSRIRVYKKLIPDFLEFEKVLRDEGISYKDYTETVLKLLEKWAEDKGMDFVPIPTFLSTFGLGRYLSVVDSQTVEVVDDNEFNEMLHSELLVGRLFIAKYVETRGDFKLRDAVEELTPLLSQDWLDAYESGFIVRPIAEAVEIIAQENGVIANNYLDIADKIILYD